MTTRKDAAVRPLPSLAVTNRAHHSRSRLSQTPAGASCAPCAQRPPRSLGAPFSPGWQVASLGQVGRVLLLVSNPVALRMPEIATAFAVLCRQAGVLLRGLYLPPGSTPSSAIVYLTPEKCGPARNRSRRTTSMADGRPPSSVSRRRVSMFNAPQSVPRAVTVS